MPDRPGHTANAPRRHRPRPIRRPRAMQLRHITADRLLQIWQALESLTDAKRTATTLACTRTGAVLAECIDQGTARVDVYLDALAMSLLHIDDVRLVWSDIPSWAEAVRASRDSGAMFDEYRSISGMINHFSAQFRPCSSSRGSTAGSACGCCQVCIHSPAHADILQDTRTASSMQRCELYAGLR